MPSTGRIKRNAVEALVGILLAIQDICDDAGIPVKVQLLDTKNGEPLELEESYAVMSEAGTPPKEREMKNLLTFNEWWAIGDKRGADKTSCEAAWNAALQKSGADQVQE